jgi:hypothetical protein
MTMSIILADAIDKGFINVCTQSVTLAANDVLLFRFSFRKVGSAAFPSFTWNSLPCTIFSDQNSRDVRTLCGYIKAPVGATANLVSPTSPTFAQANLGIVVVRSPTNAMLSNPVKSFGVAKLDTETPHVLPSIPITGLVANDLAVSFLDWLGWDKDYANVQSTTAVPSAPLSLSDSVQNSNNLNCPGRMYISTATGITGSQSFAHTKSGAGNPMYNAAVVVLYESLYVVDSFNSSSDIKAGQTGIPYTTTGFTSITGITSNQAGVTVGSIADSSGDGTASVSGFADGVQYPSLPASVTYTFSDGTNTAPITKNLTLPDGWTQVSFVNATPFNDRVFAWHLQQDGISIADGTRAIYPIILDGGGNPAFEVLANGDTDSDALRTVKIWVRDVSTGLMSEWDVTLEEGGEVVNASRVRNLTADIITAVSLSARSLSAS